MIARRNVWSGLLAFAAACPIATLSAQVASSVSRDSAGVRLVDNAAPLWTPRTAWTLSAAPILTIGPDGGSAYQFSRIAAAMKLGDGRIVIADRAALQLQFFDASGRHMRTVGGKGEGAGEFSDIGMVTRLPGDSLAVESVRHTSIFAPDGSFVRHVSYGPFALGLLQVPFVAVLGRFDNGTAVVVDFPQGRRAPHGAARFVDSSTVLLVSASGAVLRDVGRVPAAAFAASVGAPTPLTFGPELVHASARNRVVMGFGNEFAVREYDDTWTLRRIIRRAWTPRSLTAADLDTYVDAWMTTWSTETGAKRDRERLAQINAPYPDALPAFSDLLASASGELWLRDPSLVGAPACWCLSGLSDTPSTWTVFDASGVWLGTVRMPARFTPSEVGTDYVLGYLRDTANAPRVVMYRIVKPR